MITLSTQRFMQDHFERIDTDGNACVSGKEFREFIKSTKGKRAAEQYFVLHLAEGGSRTVSARETYQHLARSSGQINLSRLADRVGMQEAMAQVNDLGQQQLVESLSMAFSVFENNDLEAGLTREDLDPAKPDDVVSSHEGQGPQGMPFGLNGMQYYADQFFTMVQTSFLPW